jgi:hypothetical protein
MKKVFLVLFILFVLSCVSRSKLDQLEKAIENNELTEAMGLFEKYKYKFRKADYLYFAGRISNLAQDYQESSLQLNKLWTECFDELSDSLQAQVLIVQFENFRQLHDQENIEITGRLLLEDYSTFCDSVIVRNIINKIVSIQ